MILSPAKTIKAEKINFKNSGEILPIIYDPKTPPTAPGIKNFNESYRLKIPFFKYINVENAESGRIAVTAVAKRSLVSVFGHSHVIANMSIIPPPLPKKPFKNPAKAPVIANKNNLK